MEEKDKYKNLHLLIDRVSARLAAAEEENTALRAKVKDLQSSLKDLDRAQAAARELKTWKDNTAATLKKLYSKIDKEINKIEEQSSRPNIGDL